MQKWEYTNLYTNEEVDGTKSVFIGNKKVQVWRKEEGTKFLIVLNELGELGWEVVLRQNDGGFLLKRPKS